MYMYMNILKINNSNILITNVSSFKNDYYQYILSMLKYIIEKNNLSININFALDGSEYDFNNSNQTIKIHINFEHTLVKEGGRSVPKNTPIGKIIYSQSKHYLVRIDRYQNLNTGDIVIDYSYPNIFNVKESGLFNDFSHKHIYIAPCLYGQLHMDNKNRQIQSLTTFININQPRRKELLQNISHSSLNHSNINNSFDKHELQELYKNTKVLINIHQTPHHDTFEELRCLPALQNGVIVVSEKSPLSHLVPYNELIIWSDYDNIINKTKEVLENYEEYHKKKFTKKYIDILNNMDTENKKDIKENIIRLSTSHEMLYILANKYGLDKSISTGCHNYIPGYTKLFQNIRYSVKHLLEIGIGSVENGQMGGNNGLIAKKYNYKTGNSLKCWSEYFPNSSIYGIDIYSHPELNKNKIMTFVANQNSVQDLKTVIDKINAPLDIIIDDGSHQGKHQVFSFMYLHKYLAPEGIYVIEDVQPENIEGFKNLSIFPEDFKKYINQNFYVECFDTRNTCNRLRIDDFMISFTKK
jgi:hypothetical protein